jgi:chromosome segregation ATPase
MKKIFAALFSLGILSASFAQHPLGLMVGDFNSPYSYSLNPALSRTNPGNRLYINWWGGSVNAENNFMSYNAPFRLGQWANGNYPEELVNTNGTLAFNQDWLPTNLGKDNWNLNYLNEVWGPSIFFPLGSVGAMGFGMKAVSGFSINGLDADLGGIMRYGMPQINNKVGQTINQNHFSMNTERYQEWYMTFSGFNNTSKRHSWRWGLTSKLLLGMGVGHLGADDISFRIDNSSQITINQMNARLLTSAGNMRTLINPFGGKFDFVEGAGAGMDVGVMYEYRPNAGMKRLSNSMCDREKSLQYSWKWGASITDLGFISYWGRASEILSTGNQVWKIDPQIIQNGQFTQGDNKLDDLHNRLFGDLGANEEYEFLSYSPVAFNMQFDKRFFGGWHLGAYWTHSLRQWNSVGLRRASYLSVVPRFQSENLEYGFPLTLSHDYTKQQVGAYVRMGPVTIGSDNLYGLSNYIANNNYTGASFYFGFRSKIGGCYNRKDWYSFTQRETEYDTTYQYDTVKVVVKKTINDTTVVTERNKVNPEVAKISAEADKLKKENDKLKQEKDNCDKSKAQITADAQRCKSEVDKLTAEAIDWKKREAQILADIKAKEDEIKKLKNSPIPSPINNCDECKKQLTQAQIDVEKAKADLKNSYEELGRVKAQISATEKKCDEEKKKLQDANDKAQAEILAWKGQKEKADIEIVNLKDQIKATSDGITNKQLADLMAEKTALQTQLNEAKKCCTEASALKLEVAILKNEKLALENESNRNKAQIEALKSQNSALGDRINLLENQKKKCESDLAAEKSKTGSQIEATKDNTDLINKINECDKLVAQLKSEKATLELKIKNLESDNKICQEKLTAANSKIVATEDCTPIKTKNAQLTAENEALKKQVAQLTAEKKALSDKLNNTPLPVSGEDCGPYKVKITALEAQLAEAKKSSSDVTALNTKIASLEAQLAEAKKSSSDVTALNTKIASLEAQLAEAKKSTTAAQAQVTSLQADLKKCNEEKSALQASASSSNNNAQLEAQIAELQKQLTSKNSEIQTLKSKLDECDNAKAQIQASLNQCNQEKTKTLDEYEQLKAQIIQMDDDMGKLGEIIKKNNAEITRLKSEVSTLQTQLKECKSKIAPAPGDPEAN